MNNKSSHSLNSIRSVEALTEAIGSGAKFKYIYFWGHTGTGVGAHVLSQWYPIEFYEQKILFRSAEHYMMYQKALLFDDKDTADQILKADDPGKAKALGRQIRKFEEPVWMSNRFEIVVKGCVLKFADNPELKTYLCNSNPRILVEASPRDKIWGIGMDAKDELVSNPFRWKGENLLGFALMEARDRLLRDAA